MAAIIQPFFAPDNLVAKCLEYAATQEHIMDFTRLRALGSLFSMLNQMVRNILLYNHQHADFPMQSDQVSAISERKVEFTVCVIGGAACAQVPGLFYSLELCRRCQNEGDLIRSFFLR